jgi:hypothetical protein
MKKIAIVFMFFFFLSTGILLFFVSQTKKTQNIASQAKDGHVVVLPLLIDDCNVLYSDECPVPGLSQDVPAINLYVKKILQSQPNPKLLSYTETHVSSDLPELFSTQETGTFQLSLDNMISRLSYYKKINYNLLITLLNSQTQNYLSNPEVDIKHPFTADGSLFSQLDTMSDTLLQNMGNVIDNQFVIDDQQYTFAANMNQGSKTIYSILASDSTSPQIFEKKIEQFKSDWRKITSTSPLSSSPHFLKPRIESLTPPVSAPNEQLLPRQ